MAVYDKNGRMIKSAKLKPNETHNVFEWQQIFNRTINFTNWIDKYYVDAAKFHKAMVRYYEMEDIDIAEYVSACLALIRDSNFKKDLLRLVKEHFHVDLEPITSSRKPIKSVRDDRTGEEDYETKWEYVDELCDRAIEAMNGDRDAMFFGPGLNGSDFVVKGHYIDIMESKSDYNTPNDLWADVCTSLSMEKLLRITEAKDRINYTLFIDWTGNGLMNSLNRNENSLRAVFGK